MLVSLAIVLDCPQEPAGVRWLLWRTSIPAGLGTQEASLVVSRWASGRAKLHLSRMPCQKCSLEIYVGSHV